MEQQLYDLPEGWEWKGFLDVFSTSGFKVGKIPKKDFQTEGSLPIIDQSQSYIAGYCESDEGFNGKLPVIVYGDHTNSVKHIDFQFICGADGTKVLVPNEEVYSWYLFYAILQFRPDSQGYRRHFPILKQKHIPLPPLNEQKRIVAKLDALFTRIDAAITYLQETLELSKALFASALDEMFVHCENTTTVGELAELVQYGLSSSSHAEGAYPFIRMGDLQGGVVLLDGLKYVNVSNDEFDKYALRKGDLLFNRTNSYELVGKTSLWTHEIPAVFASYLIRLRFPEGAVPNFFNYYLNAPSTQETLKGMAARAINQSNINATKLKSIEIPLPTMQGQVRIVAHLDALAEHNQALEAETQERLDQLTALKSSLLDAAFRGQL